MDDECCPDFSCCISRLKSDEATRIIFASANKSSDADTVSDMLMAFFGKMIGAKLGADPKDVHIVLPERKNKHQQN